MKKKIGRPSSIEKIDLRSVEYVTNKGLTDKELARIMGVSEQTINTWKHKYPVFLESLKAGKFLADEKVVASLFQRACGYSHPAVDVKVVDYKVEQVPIIKHYPPDPTSCIFWLKNRRRSEWPDRHEVVHTKFVFELVGKIADMVNKNMPDQCPHCHKELTLRSKTIKELEDICTDFEKIAEVSDAD